MHNDDIDLINDEPYGIDCEQPGIFLIRYKGTKAPFAVIVADNDEQIFYQIDEFADPFQCEQTALVTGDGYHFDGITSCNLLRIEGRRAWRSVDCSLYLRGLKQEKLARLEDEVADLQGVFKDLKRKANDRFNGHRRRARKDAGAVAQAGPGEDHSHGGEGSHRVRPNRAGYVEG